MSTADTADRSWARLGHPRPDALKDARLQVHWACQTIAALAQSHGDARPDFSHTNLGWQASCGELVGYPTAGDRPVQAALHLETLTLRAYEPLAAAPTVELPLSGRTLDEAYRWLADAYARGSGAKAAQPLERPTYELPAHGVSSGQSFTSEPSALAEMARWYANADLVLREVASRHAGASPVRCWPHHLDIATLIALDPGADAESARSVGVGMTPGDEGYPEPYWYVTPWPYPEGASPPEPEGGGHWNREGWFGAVLPAAPLVAVGTAEDQAERARRFLASAVGSSLELLG